MIDEGGSIAACGGIETFPSRGEAEFRWVMVSPAAKGRRRPRCVNTPEKCS